MMVYVWYFTNCFKITFSFNYLILEILIKTSVNPVCLLQDLYDNIFIANTNTSRFLVNPAATYFALAKDLFDILCTEAKYCFLKDKNKDHQIFNIGAYFYVRAL
jgi:hypothetical protein